MSKRKRNKYQFKWWHGVLGLVGLSMVLGTVRAVAASRGAAMRGSYRNYIIEIEGPIPGGYRWTVWDQNGEALESGTGLTAGAAYSGAQAYVDWYLDGILGNKGIAAEPLKWHHPAGRQIVLGAIGHGAPTNGRRALLETRPWDGSGSWQQQWDTFTRST